MEKPFRPHFNIEKSERPKNCIVKKNDELLSCPLMVVSRMVGILFFDRKGKFVGSFISQTFISLSIWTFVYAIYLSWYFVRRVPWANFLAMMAVILMRTVRVSLVIIMWWVHYATSFLYRKRASVLLRILNRQQLKKNFGIPFKISCTLFTLIGIFLMIGHRAKKITWDEVIGSYLYFSIANGSFLIAQQFVLCASVLSNQLNYLQINCFVDTAILKHQRLLLAARELNVIYSHYLIIFYVTVLISFIFHAFWTVVDTLAVSNDNVLIIPPYLAYNATASLAWLFQIITVTGCAVNLRTKADTFNSKLFEQTSSNPTLLKNKRVMLYTKVKPSIQMSACGFFNLTYPVVTSVIAACFTYVVALVQFSIPN